MPAMPRLNAKTTKIAYKIIGIPAPLRAVKKTPEQKKINRRLLYEETFRVR